MIGYDATNAVQDFQNAAIKLQMYKRKYRDFSNAAELRTG
jgi:hypothetical protein